MIFEIFSCILLSLVSLLALKIALSWNNLQFYKKQGIKTVFSPFMGQLSIIFNKSSEKYRRNPTLYLCDLVKDNSDSPCIVVNNINSTDCFMFLYDPKLKREFLSKETEVAPKTFNLNSGAH